eukprot:CAMPEP_0198109666 /NCGR_PEP_ID=MMETSP1442-20131203/1730_1 /TAXON_ID= /ORGANISM="Craspedostauros australis, Strain CCMP3328" /LENGTH=50 /DNA_ID=CAMNT_0043765431 /DNA_START=15 /DNA_END=167 /DNA_ORIENTATION=-
MAALMPIDRMRMVLYVGGPCGRNSGGGTVSLHLLIAGRVNSSPIHNVVLV